jgi:hypothetical protein
VPDASVSAKRTSSPVSLTLAPRASSRGRKVLFVLSLPVLTQGTFLSTLRRSSLRRGGTITSLRPVKSDKSDEREGESRSDLGHQDPPDEAPSRGVARPDFLRLSWPSEEHALLR